MSTFFAAVLTVVAIGVGIAWAMALWSALRAVVSIAESMRSINSILYHVVYGEYSVNVSVFADDDDPLQDWLDEEATHAARKKNFGSVHPIRSTGTDDCRQDDAEGPDKVAAVVGTCRQ